jgi:hypothetical protein
MQLMQDRQCTRVLLFCGPHAGADPQDGVGGTDQHSRSADQHERIEIGWGPAFIHDPKSALFRVRDDRFAFS